MTPYGKNIPVAIHVKSLGNGELACFRVSDDEPVYPSVVGSGELYSHGHVWFCRTDLSCYGDAFVYVNFVSVYVGSYVRTIAGFNRSDFTHANYNQKNERYESKTNSLSLFHTHSKYYIHSKTSYNLRKTRKNRILEKVAPGKGFEPLRAKGPLAGLSLAQALFVPIWDLEASAITTPPPRLD